ncbi:MAG: hypothetical protein ILO68_00695 [Clostridia bacterium]|nr:hypothetical protein [Clostridia bacterium]
MIFLPEIQYKANLHCHSTLSDGRLTPPALKAAYKERGYSVLAITDHERPVDHTAMSDPDFLMLTGYEAYIRPDPEGRFNKFAPEVHLNLFAENPHNVDLICAYPAYIKYVPAEERASLSKAGSDGPRAFTPDYVNSFIRTAREDGYLVAYNHPVWSLQSLSDVLSYEGCFSMEICTFNSLQEGMQEYNGAMYDALLRSGKRLAVHGTDDNHNVHPFSHPASDSFGSFTMICPRSGNLTYGDVFGALKEGSFYASTGPEIRFLETDGTTVRVKTSPAEVVYLMFGSKNPRAVWAEPGNGPLTEAEFKIPDDAPFFRIHVRDGKGGCADTRGYFRDEIAP